MTETVGSGLRLSGRVQGVGFRWWARERGTELGVDGTVRNCPDGTVEVHLHGDPERVERMKRHLAEGPALASVERVEEIPPQPVDAGFRIVR